MELVTFLSVFPKDYDVAIHEGRYVVYTGDIKGFMSLDFERRVFGDSIVKNAVVDNNNNRLIISI